jgi:hypothetical protein
MARWMTATALSLLGGTATFAQDALSVTPPTPVFRPAASITPPTPTSTAETYKSVVKVNHTMTTVPTTVHQPTSSYTLNPHFGYYPTQWRPFPGTPGIPGCDVPAPPLPPVSSILTQPYEQIGPPKTPAVPMIDSTLPLIPMPSFDPPPPKLMGDTPLPKLLNDEPPKLRVPEMPPKPLLLDTPKPNPLKTEPVTSPTTGPALNLSTDMPDRFTPPDLRDKLPPLPSIGFAETRATSPTSLAPKLVPELKPLLPEVPALPPVVVKPVVTLPVKKASLGVPKPVEDNFQLPIIRSGNRIEDEAHRPGWPIIRNGTPK